MNQEYQVWLNKCEDETLRAELESIREEDRKSVV